MTRVFCFKHPEYRGSTKPVLKCKTCCKMYIDRIREENENRCLDPIAWVDAKLKNLEQRYSR